MTKVKKEVNLIERPFLKKIILYVIPLLFTGLLQTLYNAADLVVVGKFRGPGALAAVGTTASLTNLILGLFLGLSVGAGVVVAQQIGALDHKRVSKVVHSAVSLALVLGVLVGVIGFLLSRTLLSWMGTVDSAEYNTLSDATLYLKIIFCGVPASLVYNYCASIVNATGETKKPLLFLGIAGLVNVILNLILVAGFGMGVEGVAIGTIASQYLSAAMIIIYMIKAESSIKFSPKKLCFDGKSIKQMLIIGIPSGVQSCLFSLSNVLIQSSVNSFGDLVMAGNAAAGNLEGFVYVAVNAVSRASLTFTGQNAGAKRYKNIKYIVFQTAACAAAIGIFASLIILLFRNFFVGLYISGDGITPEALEITINAAMTRLFIMMPAYFLCGVMECISGTTRGLGRSANTMIFSLLGACAFRIAWLFTMFKLVLPTVECIYISYPISWLFVILLDVSYLIYYYKKLTKRKATEEFFDNLKKHTYT